MKILKQQKMKQLTDINSRKIVIHHTHILGDQLILSLLKDNDVLFFDDCLYSQYLFLKKNNNILLSKNIICILGFSASLYRTNQIPFIEDSAIIHNKVHAKDNSALGGFMSLDELRELLAFDNIFLAGHGSKHLDLQNMRLEKLQQTKLFIEDINEMKQLFKKFNFQTDIFVYPYTYYDFPCSDIIIRNNRFKYIFGCKNTMRMSIENVRFQKFDCNY